MMMITDQGTIIRTPVSGINLYSRTASGVIVMRLAEGSTIINFARIEKEEEIEKQSAEAESAEVSSFGEEDAPEESVEKEDAHLQNPEDEDGADTVEETDDAQ